MASLRAKFQEHLSCAICLEQFQNPKVLPCLHSYCHNCIVKLGRTGDHINCPECRMAVKVGNPPDISFLPSNFFANNLIATLCLTSDSQIDNIVCENCDSKDRAETRCEQCNRYLCKFCTAAHKRVRDTKDHTMKSLNELTESQTPIIVENIRCSKHQDEIIKLYCTTCQSTICRDCTIIEHRDHDFSFVSDVAQKKKEELQKLVEEVKKRKEIVSASLANVIKREGDINSRTQSTITKINQYFDTHKNRFAGKANSLKDAKLKQLHVQREELEITLASCESNIAFTEQAFKNGNDIQILNMNKYISQSLQSLKNKNTVTTPCVDDHIEFLTSPTKSNVVDQTVLFCSVVERKKEPKFKISFENDTKSLTVGCEAVIMISGDFDHLNPANNVCIKPLFTEGKVKDVTLWKCGSTRIVKFVPVQVGMLKCDILINDLCPPGTTLTKTVGWEWLPHGGNIYRCANALMESGIHIWEIKLDHSDCNWHDRADFTIGVIGVESRKFVGLTGFVTSDCSISLILDMSRKELFITPSWGICPTTGYDITSPIVSPYFETYCPECFPKITRLG